MMTDAEVRQQVERADCFIEQLRDAITATAAAAWLLLLPLPALAQQQGGQQPPPAQQQAPSEWAKLPRMQLERQFAGPLRDTIIQRWRDPVDGTICYVYLPITAAHSPPGETGYVQYGANTIGSLSCSPPPPATAPAKPRPAKKDAPQK